MKTVVPSNSSVRGITPAKFLGMHRWLGRVLMLYLCMVFLSGTLLVFGDELESLISPQMQQKTSTDLQTSRVSAGALLDAAQAAYPQAHPLILRPPKSDWFAASVEMRQKGQDFIVWIDPVTAAVQGKTSVLGPKELLRRLHVSLLVQGRLALMVTSSVSLLLLAQLGFGLASYRRFWRGYTRLPAMHQQGRSLWAGWHRWAGLWSLPMLSVICLTGSLYFSETLGFAPNLPEPARAAQRTAALPEGFDGADLDAAVKVALTGLAGLDIREIYFPLTAADGIVLRGDLDAVLVRPRANAVTVDPVTLAPLGMYRGEDLSLARRLTEAADPLHYGTWGGLLSRIIWLCSGVLTVLLTISALKVTSWRLATRPDRPSHFGALRAIFLPARLALMGAVIVVAATALRLAI